MCGQTRRTPRETTMSNVRLLCLCLVLMAVVCDASPSSYEEPSFVKPSFVKPSFAEPIPNITAAAGTDVSMPCVIDNIGEHWVAWIRNHKMLTLHDRMIMQDPRYSVTDVGDRTWWLNITRVQESDEGTYTCEINPSSIMMHDDAYLKVNADARRKKIFPPQETATSTETEPSSNSSSTGGAVLLYANKKDVRRLDLRTKEDSLLADGFSRASAVDFSYQFEQVFWTDFDKGQIYITPFPAGSPVYSFRSNIHSNGLAVDWVHLNIYWTDDRRNSVDVCPHFFDMHKTLFRGDGVDEPGPIVLHPEDGWLFWADWGRVPRIERAGMDGSNRQTIVETGADWTHALAIDLNLRKIYWADGDQKKIFSVNFDGSGRLTVVHAPDLLHLPFSMDVLGDDLYWSESKSRRGSIFKTNKLTGGSRVKVQASRRFALLMSIKLYHSSKQPMDIPNRCESNRCSEMCLPSPRLSHVMANYSCACPDGRTLQPDGRTCSPEE